MLYSNPLALHEWYSMCNGRLGFLSANIEQMLVCTVKV